MFTLRALLKDRHVLMPVKRHGLSNTPEYSIYMSAKCRCTNPNDKNYADYGGRGIEFRFTSFEQFIDAVGNRPAGKYSLDRIDNTKHYEAGNLRWSTKSEQNRNQRKRFVLEKIPDELLIAEVRRRNLTI